MYEIFVNSFDVLILQVGSKVTVLKNYLSNSNSIKKLLKY